MLHAYRKNSWWVRNIRGKKISYVRTKLRKNSGGGQIDGRALWIQIRLQIRRLYSQTDIAATTSCSWNAALPSAHGRKGFPSNSLACQWSTMTLHYVYNATTRLILSVVLKKFLLVRTTANHQWIITGCCQEQRIVRVRRPNRIFFERDFFHPR